MSDYTPTTEAARKAAISDDGGSAIRPAEFDRWLAEVKAQAWDEAIREAEACGWMHDRAQDEMIQRNPYRQQT